MKFNHVANNLINHAYIMNPPIKTETMRLQEFPGWLAYPCAGRGHTWEAWEALSQAPSSTVSTALSVSSVNGFGELSNQRRGHIKEKR